MNPSDHVPMAVTFINGDVESEEGSDIYVDECAMVDYGYDEMSRSMSVKKEPIKIAIPERRKLMMAAIDSKTSGLKFFLGTYYDKDPNDPLACIKEQFTNGKWIS